MTEALIEQAEETIKPPLTSVGVLGWIKANLFNSWFNSLLTVATLYFLLKITPAFIRWAFVDSLWKSTGA